MKHSKIDLLPAYIDDDGGHRFFLDINRTLNGTWSASYTGWMDLEVDEELYQTPIMYCGFVNDCEDLNEVYTRMSAKLKRNGVAV